MCRVRQPCWLFFLALFLLSFRAPFTFQFLNHCLHIQYRIKVRAMREWRRHRTNERHKTVKSARKTKQHTCERAKERQTKCSLSRGCTMAIAIVTSSCRLFTFLNPACEISTKVFFLINRGAWISNSLPGSLNEIQTMETYLTCNRSEFC